MRLFLSTKYCFFVVTLVCVALSACSSKPASRYSMEQDTAPNYHYGEIDYKPVVPVKVTPYKWTAKPYTVNGVRYVPMQSAKGVVEVGEASWYGQKFHGHKTANGEIFNMFALTAAHKTLPLPSFVRVTNLQNGEKVIVRVNDRGPFHSNRILDLSYGAAKMLGYSKLGVTDIRMEVLHVNDNGEIFVGENKRPYQYKDGELQVIPYQAPPTQLASQPVSEDNGLFVQVLALSNKQKAQDLASGLTNLLQIPSVMPKIENIYKLRLGPLDTEQKAQNVIQQLKALGFDNAFTINVLPSP